MDVATRLPRTPPFSRLLRHAGGYSRTILTPNLQGLELSIQSAVTIDSKLVRISPSSVPRTLEGLMQIMSSIIIIILLLLLLLLLYNVCKQNGRSLKLLLL